ncbi:transposase family protein [Actinomadura sp. HBU206391]|nr:DDE-type integrase/transposase/recombinase [Actinomadura sp. HBU206391]MBC6459138.1 transposase family protein [Actinomadura sp. HBU206391]
MSDAERERVLAVLNSPRFADKSPGQVWAVLLDEDVYLCSHRKVVHWEIWPTENGTLAKEFLTNAIAANGGIRPASIHADRGTSMTSNTVTGLLALLGIDQSHSRPHVSNDNPYSEAQFKTLKYCPAFPGKVRVHRRRQRLLYPILHLLQQRTPPFRDRNAHPYVGARRHRCGNPGPAYRNPP